jgi:hypothetical protein
MTTGSVDLIDMSVWLDFAVRLSENLFASREVAISFGD